MTLELRDDSDLLTAGEVAKLAGVSSQTVRNWWKAGRLTAAEERPYRGAVQPMFRRGEALEKQIEQAKGRGGSGGRREGAGRKPANAARGGARRRANAGEDGIGLSVAEAAGELERVLDREDADVRALLDWLERHPHSADAVLLVAGKVGLTAAAIDRRVKAEQARKARYENRLREGELLEAEDVRRATAAQLAGVRQGLEAFPGRVARVVAEHCWPRRDETESVLDLLRAVGTDAAAVEQVEAFLALPADVPVAVRQVLEREIRGVLHELAGR